MEKRGQFEINFIIATIVAIVGFGIILLVYYQLNWTGTLNSETCHQSVIYRATLPTAKGIIPLKCQTDKICVTTRSGVGNCPEFKNDKAIQYVKVSDGSSGINQIESVYANSILKCWEMMGQGKVSLFSDTLIQRYGISIPGYNGQIAPSCVICDRIAIDKNSFSQTDFSKINVINYMSSHFIPGGTQNYIQKMSGGLYNSAISIQANFLSVPSVQQFDDQGNPLPNPNSQDVFDLEKLPSDSYGKSDLKETAIVFMQVVGPPGYFESVTNILKDSGISLVTSAVIAPGATYSLGKGAISLAKSGGWYSLVALAIIGVYQQGSVYFNRDATVSYCGDVSIGEKSMRSCSVVRSVTYDAASISEYCPNIESIP